MAVLSPKTFKIIGLWVLFILASCGTYALSHTIQSRSNGAALFLASGKTYEIGLYAEKIDVTQLSVHRGDEVIFRVKDDSRHNIAEERQGHGDARFESGELSGNDSYSLRFNEKGTVYLYDRLNLDITIAIVVQ